MKSKHLLPLALLTILGACTAPGNQPPPVSTPTTVNATATPPVVDVATPTQVTTPTGETGTPTPDRPEATEVPVAASPTAPGNGPSTGASNLFGMLLGTSSAPEGWTVRPCEGEGPFLCVMSGNEHVGSVELGYFPLEMMTDFRGMLQQEGITGLPSASFDHRNQETRSKSLAALKRFVENYHSIFEHDRELTYQGQPGTTYNRLPTEEMTIGELPGVRYGFTITQDGKVLERWLSYSAFDGERLYTVVANFHPTSIPTFRSDEELQTFAPHLARIVEGLKLPPPEAAATVKQVTTRAEETPVYRLYSPFGLHAELLPAGETLEVTAQSPDGHWWRVKCRDDITRSCWVSADKVTESTAP